MRRRFMSNSIPEGAYEPSEAPTGVYVVSTDGFVYEPSAWNTNNNDKAVGVGVKTENCSFVIAPEEQNLIEWGGQGIVISGCTVADTVEIAKLDYNGIQNTDAIVRQLGTSIEYAAPYCKNYTFKNGQVGYLPALGELFEAHQNKSEVDSCMSLIGGKTMFHESIENYWKLSSTQQTEKYIYNLNWGIDTIFALEKDTSNKYNSARPFTSFP